MKKLSEIVKLPIMEILNGQIAGSVKDVIINPDTKEAILVIDVSVFSDFQVLQRQDVQGIGEDFIMINTRQAIQSAKDNAAVASMPKEYYSIKGLTVVSIGGNVIDKIADFTIDEKTWQLEDVILENGTVFSKGQLVSLSEKYAFIQKDGNAAAMAEPNISLDDLQETAADKEPELMMDSEFEVSDEVEMDLSADGEMVDSSMNVSPEVHVEEEETPEPAFSAEPAAEPKSETPGEDLSPEELYLLGLTLKADVVTEDGSFMINKGTVLTKEIINDAKENGVLANLLMDAE